MTNHANLQSYLDAACDAARRGADVLNHWRHVAGGFNVQEKARFDLVTEADVGSQRAIREYLSQQFPDHDFLGEEDKSTQGRRSTDAPPTWIVDPLDGTTNFVHDFPFYCVSIGLWLNGALRVGVVFDPSRNELFRAAEGLGAWLNDRRLHTTNTAQMEQALLSTGFPPDLRGQEQALDWWRFLSFRTQSLRRTGSTALNLVYVAAGRFDGYWAFDNHVWDVAGGTVIVQEAGGIITNVDGTPFDPFTPDAAVSNGPLHPALLAALREGP